MIEFLSLVVGVVHAMRKIIHANRLVKWDFCFLFSFYFEIHSDKTNEKNYDLRLSIKNTKNL